MCNTFADLYMAYELWTTVFPMFGVHWTMLHRVVDLLACWQGRFGQHRSAEIWKVIPHCLMWCLWWERNSRLFEDCERNILDLGLQFLMTLSDSRGVTWLFSSHTFLKFLDLCTFKSLFVDHQVHL